MFRLSDNYYQRKCYFKQEQVPTQSIMKDKMCVSLANVYFKSMRPRLKVLAGLEPPMKGGGNDWYMPPSVILEEGRAVLQPVKKEYLIKLGFNGIDFFGEQILAQHRKSLRLEKEKALLESDINWKKTIEDACRQYWLDISKEAQIANTKRIQKALREFTTMYSTSLNNIEKILFDAAVMEVDRVRSETFNKMSKHFEKLLKYQATSLYDEYTEKLNNEKARLKAEFIENLENARTNMCQQLHDINVEKHVAIEKLRHYLECQNLACRVYVALKEREECSKEMQLAAHEHAKKVKVLKEEIAMKDLEILLAKEKEKKRLEFIRVWQRKICEVVKKLQLFVSYCLNSLPEHAEFFLNMEKLMMLQLDEAMENPSVESLFVPEEDGFHTPIPRPHPFFLFCDKGYKPQLNQDLCPKHCTSSASQLPVIVVNKRCIYAACDNFEKFTDKIKEYIHGRRGDDKDFIDTHDYTYNVPVKFTHSQQLLDLKLESSLLQVLQMEHPNIKEVQTECCVCNVPYCFCDRLEATKIPSDIKLVTPEPSLHSHPSGNKIERRIVELEHEREPKWESFIDYVKPRRCKCAKAAKKTLREHLPAYMRNTSVYESLELPHYETCSLTVLKQLVKKAQGKRTPPEPIVVESKTRNASTQYLDQEFEMLCTCFSEDELERVFKDLFKTSRPGNFDVVDGSVSPSFMAQSSSSFATDRAYSLRKLVGDSPELENIFKTSECSFN